MYLFCIVSALTATVAAIKTMVDDHEEKLKFGGTVSTALATLCNESEDSNAQCCYNPTTFKLLCLPTSPTNIAAASNIDTSTVGTCDESSQACN